MKPEELNKALKAARAKKLEEKAVKDAIKDEFKVKEKVKKLTTDQRLERLERLMGIEYNCK